MTSPGSGSLPQPAAQRLVDPRGLRFAAAITTIVLAVVLVSGSGWLLLFQVLVFAVGAIAGLRYAPYGLLFKATLRRRLGPPAELEPEAPPRFAQSVGLGFTAVALAGYLAGVPALGFVFTAFALIAAFLNGAFGFCLGCEVYLLIRRFSSTRKGVTA
jgi:hypothetical protein